MSEYLSNSQLRKKGFLKIGKNNKISKSLKTYNFKGNIGSNNRIDEDVILKGNVNLKNNIHLARGCTLSAGMYSIDIDDFVSLSNYVQLFCVSDDYKASALTGGTLTLKERKKFSKSYEGNIKIGKCCIIGPFSIVLPNSTIEDFVSVSPYNVIYGKLKGGIYYSISKKKIIKDQKKIKEMYNKFVRYFKSNK